MNAVRYPTDVHARAAERIVEFFGASSDVDAVLLIGSCARGQGSEDIDFAVLLRPELGAREREELERAWRRVHAEDPVFEAVRNVGEYGRTDLDLIVGHFAPQPRGWTSGPDSFELEIGNYLVYSVPLWERDDAFRRLRNRWLPYYDDGLRRQRLAMVRRFCQNNLHHIPWYAARGLHFQAFNRFYDAFREFIQALFIQRRTYPIAYDKWIREQVEEILGLPELYPSLPALLEIRRFESDEIVDKAQALRSLLEEYTAE